MRIHSRRWDLLLVGNICRFGYERTEGWEHGSRGGEELRWECVISEA